MVSTLDPFGGSTRAGPYVQCALKWCAVEKGVAQPGGDGVDGWYEESVMRGPRATG